MIIAILILALVVLGNVWLGRDADPETGERLADLRGDRENYLAQRDKAQVGKLLLIPLVIVIIVISSSNKNSTQPHSSGSIAAPHSVVNAHSQPH